MTPHLPLSRFKVLDLTSHRSGPTAVRQLADWGAQVIKIEAPDAGERDVVGVDRLNPDPQNLHRNKRAMTLNLKTEDGLNLFRRLAADADVIVENFRSSVKSRLGVDYDAIAAINPRIVYGSISGFGQDGPYAERPGVDQVAQGMGGLMSITGFPGQGPLRVGIPIADLTAGHLLTQAILIALLDREITGRGQWVTTSLLEAQIFMLDFQAARWLMAQEVPGPAGNDHPTGIPTGVFATRDGHINLSALGERMWVKLCEILDLEELIIDPAYATATARSTNREKLNARITERTRAFEAIELTALLNDAGIPAGPINRIDQVFDDPQVSHLGMAVPVGHPMLGDVKLLGQPIQLRGSPRPSYVAAPEQSQHTAEILGELGLTDGEIAKLRERKVI